MPTNAVETDTQERLVSGSWRPEVLVRTDRESVEESLARILAVLAGKGLIA
jgi:hypothetical protein